MIKIQSKEIQLTISGRVYALENIFSPLAYAKKVFNEVYFNQVQFTIDGKCLEFTFTGECGMSPELFVETLIPSSKEGRKVEVNFSYKN
jgi:hypothetical protein